MVFPTTKNDWRASLDSRAFVFNEWLYNQKKSDMDFVAIDLEKLDDSQLSICEVGMVKYQKGKLVDEFHSYIKPAESET